MFVCSKCSKEVFYPLILDCTHIMCPVCVLVLRK